MYSNNVQHGVYVVSIIVTSNKADMYIIYVQVFIYTIYIYMYTSKFIDVK